MFTSIRSFRPTRRAALIAAAIVLAAASGANARSGPSASGNGSHSEAGHRASLASPRVMSPPIIAMKPGQKHHHHPHIRFFNDWYWANACARYPGRSEEAKRRIDPRSYGLARCRIVDEPVVY
jgi:hypothetical protein